MIFDVTTTRCRLPPWLSGKEFTCNAGDIERLRFDPWLGTIPWKRAWQPTPVFLPENPMDRRTWWVTVHGLQRIGHEAREHAHALYYAEGSDGG